MQISNNVQKLDIVPLRDAFHQEAYNFTRWLEENIDALSSRIGIDLTVLERERAVGPFRVDLVCETTGGRRVIIENQLDKSNHDHLGKLLTYMVNLDATMAIWITPEAHEQHKNVIEWLNAWTKGDFTFYLVQVEAIRIGDSPYAPLFTILAKRDEDIREIAEAKKQLADADRHIHRKEFWTRLLEKSKERTNLFSSISPSTENWIETSAGRSGFAFGYRILYDYAWVEMNINTPDPIKNKAFFDQLYIQKDQLESEFGLALEWQRLDDRRMSRISKRITVYGGLTSPENWSQLQDEMVDTMNKFDQVFRPKIRNL